MSLKGRRALESVAFDIEIPDTNPNGGPWVQMPEDPVAWIEALQKYLKEAKSIYMKVYSVLGDEIHISINPHGGGYKDSLCFGLDFETLDKLKRAIDFVHQEALLNREMDEVSPTAPE